MELTRQAVRFLIVGTFTNACLYITYLVITWLGLEHKLAMTLVYISGVIMGFALNRNWTFRHKGHITYRFIRYSLIYAIGYLINLGGLYLLVDIAGYPHQIVQLMIAILLAIMFFMLQRNWVFDSKKNKTANIVI